MRERTLVVWEIGKGVLSLALCETDFSGQLDFLPKNRVISRHKTDLGEALL